MPQIEVACPCTLSVRSKPQPAAGSLTRYGQEVPQPAQPQHGHSHAQPQPKLPAGQQRRQRRR